MPPPHSKLGLGCQLGRGLPPQHCTGCPCAKRDRTCRPTPACLRLGGTISGSPRHQPSSPHMGVFPLRPLERTARHRVHTRVHTSNAHSTRPPPRLHLSASTSFHFRLASNPPVRHPCLPLSSLVVLLVDPLLHRFLALDFTILKAWDYWEAPRGSLRYSWGWRCWRVVVGFWRSPEPKEKYFC